MISSRSNPRLKALATLQTRKGREAQRLAIAEGIRLCEEAFRSGIAVRTLVLSASMQQRPEAAALIESAAKRDAEILDVADDCYAKLSDLQSPEGAAVVFAPAPPALAPLLEQPLSRLLVAAGVQDPGNAGALARVAEAAGATACVFLGGVDVFAPKFLRAGMGSAFRLPCAAGRIEDFLAIARAEGVRLLAAVAEDRPAAQVQGPTSPRKTRHARRNAISFDSADYSPPMAICVGGEGAGLPPELLEAASERVFIPTAGPVESLNVAVAAGILLYQAKRCWA
jgi:RNA methyltransferase, TrmH family